jgi:hypothetical protein
MYLKKISFTSKIISKLGNTIQIKTKITKIIHGKKFIVIYIYSGKEPPSKLKYLI